MGHIPRRLHEAYILLNAYEMLIFEVMEEVFKQSRFESPRIYFHTILAGHGYTRRKQKVLCYLLPITDLF